MGAPPAPGEPLVRIDGVTKRYGDLVAVDDVSLAIEPGEIFALLGPNGAGKTTLIGCVTGLTVGFSGRITVAGYDVVRDYRVTRRLVGLVPQELNYDAFFTVRDLIRYQGGYYGEPPSERRVDELLDAFDLSGKADANSRWLSGGMKRRLLIVKALVHDPALLFLDEPTAGVDVVLREELWAYVRRLRELGTTIVLTTHYIEEAEMLADRVGIIDGGRLLRVDRREALMAEYASRTVDVRLTRPPPPELFARLPDLQLEPLAGEGVRLVYRDAEADRAADAAPSPVQRLLDALRGLDLDVASVDAHRSSLEAVFRRLVFTEDRQAPPSRGVTGGGPP